MTKVKPLSILQATHDLTSQVSVQDKRASLFEYGIETLAVRTCAPHFELPEKWESACVAARRLDAKQSPFAIRTDVTKPFALNRTLTTDTGARIDQIEDGAENTIGKFSNRIFQ